MNPFLRIGSPHNGHFLAFADLALLMEQANRESQAPPRINTPAANHTPTRKTGEHPATDLRPTILNLTLKCQHVVRAGEYVAPSPSFYDCNRLHNYSIGFHRAADGARER